MANAVLPPLGSTASRDFAGVHTEPVVEVFQHHRVSRCLHQGLVDQHRIRLWLETRTRVSAQLLLCVLGGLSGRECNLRRCRGVRDRCSMLVGLIDQGWSRRTNVLMTVVPCGWVVGERRGRRPVLGGKAVLFLQARILMVVTGVMRSLRVGKVMLRKRRRQHAVPRNRSHTRK